jgi:enoyl-CoA hydratase/carnithine racemase
MPQFQTLTYELDDGTASITLNRPAVLNAINTSMRSELVAAVRRAGEDDAVRAIVFRGAGERAFCAGADIREFEPVNSVAAARATRLPPRWNEVIEISPKPTVAAIHGYCLGGGVELALACDIRIASEDAVFSFPEVQLGIIPGAGGTQRLAHVVGLGNALDLILTARRIDARAAFAMGLVTQVAEGNALEEAVQHRCELLARGGAQAVAYAKEAVRASMDLPLAAGLRLEADLAALLTNTEDRLARADAFRGGER